MPDQPPRPSPDPGPRVEGPIRQAIDPRDADAAARTYWDAEADFYQQEHGDFLGGAPGSLVWGPEGLTEEEAHLLGPLDGLLGRRLLEVGCGGGHCSRWLRARGVAAIGLDISVAQLRHARHGNGPVPVVAGTATALPFATGAFDAALSAYGAIQFVADLPRLLHEVARVLNPGAPWVFSVTHPTRWAFPDSPDSDGLTATGSYFDRTPYVERDGQGQPLYAEFHRTLGDYVEAVVTAGFVLERIVEPEWPDWNLQEWGGWSPLRGRHLPGTLIMVCRRRG